MHRSVRLIVGIALALLTSVAVQAKEKKVKQGDLPPAVQTTIEAQTQSAGITVSGYTKDTVDGDTLYRASLVADGKPRVVTVGADGTLVSIENEVTWDSIPADVQSTFTRVAGVKGKLGDFHSVSTDGKIVSYNAMRETWGNRDRVSVKPHTAALETIPSAPPASQKK
jgi:hypothetical protein